MNLRISSCSICLFFYILFSLEMPSSAELPRYYDICFASRIQPSEIHKPIAFDCLGLGRLSTERRRKSGSDLVLILIYCRDGFRRSFARTAFAVLSRARFWFSRRHVFRNTRKFKHMKTQTCQQLKHFSIREFLQLHEFQKLKVLYPPKVVPVSEVHQFETYHLSLSRVSPTESFAN